MISFLLTILAHAAPPQSPPAKADLAAAFAAANRDAAAVVPLILEASRALPALDERESMLLGDTLEPYCRRAFFGPERLPGMERLGLAVDVVKSGELPGRIAERRRIGAGMLRYLNDGYDERRVAAGAKLKVLDLSTAKLSIVVDESAYRMRLWRAAADGTRVLVAQVPVGLGAAQSPTPAGSTRITKRVRNPEWTDPDTRQVFAPNDPRNILGGYWIALDSEGIGKSGIGLHGFTGDVPANWIERPASHGCVRMLQADIDRVFHVALEGTAVELRP
ncbi:MAG: L,D-transpeptidase [Planctomycetota bacterium]